MADLLIEGAELVLHMTPLEHAEGIHGDIRVPLAQVTGVHPSEAIWSEVHGVRAPGTGIPGHLMVGTLRHGEGGTAFAAIHGHGAGVVVELRDHEFSRLLLTADAAVALAARVAAVLAGE
jgi:hypothetical protein